MYNTKVEKRLDDCKLELDYTLTVVGVLGASNPAVAFLNKYAIIRACGAIEHSIKYLIADYCGYRSKQEVKNFIGMKVVRSGQNPSYSKILALLSQFNPSWKTTFKTRAKAHPDFKQICSSIESLVDMRNEFAHGGNPTATVANVLQYFQDFRIFVEIIDDMIAFSC